MFSIVTCNALEVAISHEGLSYLLNMVTNKARLFDIYIGNGTTRDVIVPPTVEWCNQTYVVTEVLGRAIEKNPDGISRIKLPSTLENTQSNRETCTLIYKFRIPLIQDSNTRRRFLWRSLLVP